MASESSPYFDSNFQPLMDETLWGDSNQQLGGSSVSIVSKKKRNWKSATDLEDLSKVKLCVEKVMQNQEDTMEIQKESIRTNRESIEIQKTVSWFEKINIKMQKKLINEKREELQLNKLEKFCTLIYLS